MTTLEHPLEHELEALREKLRQVVQERDEARRALENERRESAELRTKNGELFAKVVRLTGNDVLAAEGAGR